LSLFSSWVFFSSINTSADSVSMILLVARSMSPLNWSWLIIYFFSMSSRLTEQRSRSVR
jgi:hypothetical protein